MKKVLLVILILFSFAGLTFAENNENNENDNKTISQEEKTDAFFKNFINTIDKTAKDSAEKIADEIKSLGK